MLLSVATVMYLPFECIVVTFCTMMNVCSTIHNMIMLLVNLLCSFSTVQGNPDPLASKGMQFSKRLPCLRRVVVGSFIPQNVFTTFFAANDM